MESEQEPLTAKPALPKLAPPPRGANWRFTGIAVAALAVLILLKLVTTHPQPSASHSTPAAAAVGYLAAVRSANLQQLESYLPPSERDKASAELRTLSADHVVLVSPAVQGAVFQGSSATVNLTVEVCYRRTSADHYSCQLLQRQPLGLPANLQSVEVGGRWYVSTLLEPEPLTS